MVPKWLICAAAAVDAVGCDVDGEVHEFEHDNRPPQPMHLHYRPNDGCVFSTNAPDADSQVFDLVHCHLIDEHVACAGDAHSLIDAHYCDYSDASNDADDDVAFVVSLH